MIDSARSGWYRVSRLWPWGLVGGAGIVIHVGTALLRLSTFFPYPKLKDFAAFYAGAWAMRLGFSPYGWPAEFQEALQTEAGFPFYYPISPPVWLWLLQPFTVLDFSAAALVWLMVLLALVAWSGVTLAQIAGYEGRRERGIAFLLVVTFGPVFLNLTLGQNGPFLLTAALVVGQALRARDNAHLRVTLAWIPAIGAKLTPLIWLGALLLMRRWRLFVLLALVALLALSLTALLTRSASQDYWFRFLPERVSTYSDQVSVEDQSLTAWLGRVGRSHTFRVPGLSVTQQHTVTWSPPWSVSPRVLRWVGYVLTALLAFPPVIVLLRTGTASGEAGIPSGAFYLWVLYGLVVFPHTDRYNHVLLLPAMAWLWGRGDGGCKLAVIAYFLAGLSRLSHLWAILLPAPWGPLASGFGLYAVLLLGGGIAASLWSSKPPFPARGSGA